MSDVAFRGDPLKLYSKGAGVLMSPYADANMPARAFSLLCNTVNMSFASLMLCKQLAGPHTSRLVI